jgi:hypothetical protein
VDPGVFTFFLLFPLFRYFLQATSVNPEQRLDVEADKFAAAGNFARAEEDLKRLVQMTEHRHGSTSIELKTSASILRIVSRPSICWRRSCKRRAIWTRP